MFCLPPPRINRTSGVERANIIAAFNGDPKITVFLISLKAGGEKASIITGSQCNMF